MSACFPAGSSRCVSAAAGLVGIGLTWSAGGSPAPSSSVPAAVTLATHASLQPAASQVENPSASPARAAPHPPGRAPFALWVALHQSCRQGMASYAAASGRDGRPVHPLGDGNCTVTDGVSAAVRSGGDSPGSRLSPLPLMAHLRSRPHGLLASSQVHPATVASPAQDRRGHGRPFSHTGSDRPVARDSPIPWVCRPRQPERSGPACSLGKPSVAAKHGSALRLASDRA